MKKLFALILCIVMSFTLVACKTNTASDTNSSAEKQETQKAAGTSFGWYTVEIPKGYTADEYGEEFRCDADPDKIIKIYLNSNTFEDAKGKAEKSASDEGFTLGEDITLGKYTWHTVGFTWNDDRASTELYADTTDSTYVDICAFCMDTNDPDLQKFISTLTLADGDVEEAQQEWIKKINDSKK